MEGVKRIGLKWQQIARELPGRSANSVRNRYLRWCPAPNLEPPDSQMMLGRSAADAPRPRDGAACRRMARAPAASGCPPSPSRPSPRPR